MQAKREAEEAEQRIIELEHQLEAASEKVREDHLTGALNDAGWTPHLWQRLPELTVRPVHCPCR